MSKYSIIGVLLVLGLAFAAGRYSVKQSQSTVEQTSDKKTHTQRTTTTTKLPTGEVRTVTTTDTTAVVNKKKDSVATVAKKAAVNISALAGYDFKGVKPVYGLSVSKEVAGPITAGLFGLSNGTVGVSLGFNF